MIGKILLNRHLVVFLTLLLVAAGVEAYLHLGLEAYPDVANMQVRVITQVPGKAAEEVERLVTIPIEKELNGIPSSKPPRSISIFGLSVITVVFDDGVDPYIARQQVLERLTQAAVPPDVQPQLDPNASPCGEVYRYTIDSLSLSPMERKEVQDWVMDRKFKSIPGVIDVTGYGGPSKIYKLDIDPYRLSARGVTQQQVVDAITRSNGSTGGNYLVQGDQNFMVRGIGLLDSVEDIGNVVVSTSAGGVPTKVSDVADVSIGEGVRRGQVGINEDDDIVEGIVLMRRGENPSEVVDNIKASWPKLQGALPRGMKLTPLYDRTALVKQTVETIGHNVAEGVILVVSLLMLYLFQVRAALICATAIPLALLTAFILLDIFHVPANLLSLGAIDFGIIVDGAIVMVENILRCIESLDEEQRKDRGQILVAIYFAACQVVKPVMFATAIILVTFLPILTFESVEGKLFRPLAITMGFNLLGAILASMTIVPTLCAMAFCQRPPSHRESPILAFADRVYAPILKYCLLYKRRVLLFALAVVVAGGSLFPLLGSEFLPELEEGNIWLRVTILPTSVALDKSVKIAGILRHLLRQYPEVTTVVSQIGSPDDGTDPNNYSNIEFLVDLKPQAQWRDQFRHARDPKEALVDSMDKVLNLHEPGLLYNFSQYIKDNMDESIAGVKGELAIKIYGPDLKILTNLGHQISRIVTGVPGMADVAYDQMLGQPQVVVKIDRDRADRYGINSQDVLNIVETSVGGLAETQVVEGERRFPLIARFKSGFRSDVATLADIRVPTAGGGKVPLSQIATITDAHGATSILRDENSRRVAIKANIRGRDMGSAVKEAQALVEKQVQIPDGYSIVWGGQFARAQHAMARLAIIIPVTLLLIFLLLYSAFGSARIAVIVMSTVPLAAPGAIIALLLTGTHLSISAGVGFIALFGVSVQNGVILVSLIQELRRQGYSLRKAIYSGALVRMRPALITTTVAVVGLLPAAVATGIGSQSQKPFAIAIVGGLIPGIFLSLLVLPVLYNVLNKPKKVTSTDDSNSQLKTAIEKKQAQQVLH
ncbi:MAG: efflux RND transporter permease subunit [Cyanobacteria bacterium SZAS TMP-1]|nr:efflux RND transporter permease subunit [Cyanobacteria bacterium SZAS TMP-1]